MSEFITLARPYAKAAFDFADEHNDIENWTTMLDFCAQLVKNERIQEYLTSSLSVENVSKTIISICGDVLNQYGQNFIKLMAENQRLTVLPAVFQQFLALVAEKEATAEVNVISAQPLSNAQQLKIKQAMEKRLDKKVNLNCSVDNTLIAGAIIRTDDLVIDGSSRGQLARLANELQL